MSLLYIFLYIYIYIYIFFFFFDIHHIWGERVLWGAVFIYRPRTKCSISFHRNTVQKFLKSPIRPAGSNFDKRQICEEILKELRFNVIKNLLSVFFINSFIMMYNLKKRLKNSVFSVLIHTYIHTHTHTHAHTHAHTHTHTHTHTQTFDCRWSWLE